MVVSVSPSNLGLALEHLHFVEQPSSYYYDTYQPSQMLMAVPEERRSFGFAAPVEFKAALTAETSESYQRYGQRYRNEGIPVPYTRIERQGIGTGG